MPHAYIELATTPPKVRAGTTGEIPPALAFVFGTELNFTVAFMSSGNLQAAPANTTAGKLTLKADDDHGGDALGLDAAWEVEGSGAASVYRFKIVLNSAELEALLNGGADEITVQASISWTITGAAAPSIADDFLITIKNSSTRSGDDAPDANEEATEIWLNDRAIRYLPLVVGLTGGGATKLDGRVVDSTMEGDAVCLVDAGSSNVLRTYELVAGTDAESSPDVIHPDNFHASTNAFVWKQRPPPSVAPAAHAASHAVAGSDPLTLAQSQITGLTASLAAKADLESGKVPASQLPSYVDDVVEAANFGALPGTGETGKIYVTLADNKSYRWSGSAYVEIASSPQLASQAEAETGADNAKLMTPLRTRQSISATGAVDILNGTGAVQGHTDPGSGATAPPDLEIEITVNGHGYIDINYGEAGVQGFHFSDSDPTDGRVWIDDTALSTPDAYANALASAITGTAISGLSATADGTVCTVSWTGAGATHSLGASSTSTGGLATSISGGGVGVDAVSPSGGVGEVELIPAVTGKRLRLLRGFAQDTDHLNMPIQLALKTPGPAYQPVTGEQTLGSGAFAELKPDDDTEAAGFCEGVYGASLVAMIIGDPPNDAGTSVAFYVQAARDI